MGVNATLIGQMLTFALLVLFTMKFVWPPITKALAERQQKIAEGLAAAERGKHDLTLAQHEAADILRRAKSEATEIIKQADNRSGRFIEEAKVQAHAEAEKIMALAKVDIEQERQSAREILSQDIASIALATATKLLGKSSSLDMDANDAMLDELIAEVMNDK